MNNRVLLGMYFPGNSSLHRLDPRSKLLACFWYVILVFCAQGWVLNLAVVALLLVAIGLSQIPLSKYWAGIRPLMAIILLTAGLQALFSSGGTTLWQWGILTISTAGLIQADLIVLRFFLIITASTVLTSTTSPLRLADGLEALLKPLKKVGVPTSQLAMMMSIALRFVPTIMKEARQIMDAQKARGVNFKAGSLLTRAKRLVPIMVPLFVAAFKRAEELAVAMEARGYDPGAERTKYNRLTWRGADTTTLVILVAATALMIAGRLLDFV